MHRKLVPVLAVVCALAAAASAGAKDYWFPRVVVDVTVNADGSFQYRESRTYEFDDAFTFAFYQVEKLRLSGGEPVDITDFVVSENGAPLELRDQAEIDEPRTPGTYWVSYDYEGDSVYGKWFYRADDETKTFDISYTVRDAVTVHDDFAQLYWKFIAENWEKPTTQVSGFIHLPPGADPDQVRGWLHAPLTSEYWIRDAQTIEFKVDNLPPGQFVEMRIVFPTALVPGARVREAGTIWDRAFNEEKQWVEEANAERVRAQERVKAYYAAQKTGNIAAAAVAVLALLGWFGVFWRFGREHKVPFEGDYYRELPVGAAARDRRLPLPVRHGEHRRHGRDHHGPRAEGTSQDHRDRAREAEVPRHRRGDRVRLHARADREGPRRPRGVRAGPPCLPVRLTGRAGSTSSRSPSSRTTRRSTPPST